jgi:type IV pilus assembly protein PilV
MIKIDNNKGFTLIEVLVAMVILSIGLLGTAALITGIINSNKLSNRITTATVLAQDKMEEIKRAGAADKTEPYNTISDYPLYKRDVVVDPLGTDMKTVTVTVYWDADAHWVELKTILVQ